MFPNSIIYIIALIYGYTIVGVFSRAPLFPRSHYAYPWGFSQGEPAKPGEIPYQVQILNNQGNHRCGGALTLVNGTQVVITAANCVAEDVPDYFTVVAGEIGNSEMPRSSRSGQRRQVANSAYHQDYRSWNSLSNDIAILGLDKPFEMNENVQPIALPEMGRLTDGELMISGWRKGYRGALDSEVLQKVVVPVIPGFECQDSYEGEEEFFTASTICAGTYGKGPCLATPGSPMRSLKDGYLVGIVSYGYGCEEGKYIGTNVAHFVDWIQEKAAHF